MREFRLKGTAEWQECFRASYPIKDRSVEWLQACKVKKVAMESTGVYWIPLYQKLERAKMQVVLVNARHLKRVPGRKTDIWTANVFNRCTDTDC